MAFADLLAALEEVAFHPGERQALEGLQEVQADGGDLEEGVRSRNLEACLAHQAERLCTYGWCNGYQALFPERWREMAFYMPRMPSALELLRLLVRQGVGLTALEPAAGGRWWVPHSIVMLASYRTGGTIPLAAERWAMAPRFPAPHRQVLVEDMGLPEREARLLVLSSSLAPSRVLEGPSWPEEMFRADGQRPLLVEELGSLAVMDPMAAMRQLIGAFQDPLAGVLQQVALAAMRNATWMANRSLPWDGRLGFNVMGPALVTCRDTVLLKTGWLLQVMRGLGMECPGLHASALAAAEVHLGMGGGGRIMEVDAAPWLLVPSHLGGVLRQLPIDWSEVAQARE